MRAPIVVEIDSIPDHTTGVLQGLVPEAMFGLILEESDDPLDHAILLWAVVRHEFLTFALAFAQGCVVSAGE